MESTSEGGSKKGARGRPKGKGRTQLDILKEEQGNIVLEPRRKTRQEADSAGPGPRENKKVPSTTPQQATPGSTSSRPSHTFYLIGKAPDSLSLSKLPKTGLILGRLLVLMELQSLSEASQIVKDEVKTIWLHHFGPNLMLGKKFGDEANDTTDEKLKIVKTDQRITEKIVEMYRKWKSLEEESRRPDRAVKPSFLRKQEQMLLDLDMPLDIKTIIHNP